MRLGSLTGVDPDGTLSAPLHGHVTLQRTPLLVLLAIASLLVSALAIGQVRLPIMQVADIKPGMKGYGLTVFRGDEPERFDVEVIGVLHNFRPDQDLVLIRRRIRCWTTRSVGGMSGSPIFLDGR